MSDQEVFSYGVADADGMELPYVPPADYRWCMFQALELETLEEEDLMAEMVKEYTTQKGITIRIGSENTFKEIKDCSVVMSSYNIKNVTAGGMGVIGPTRMGYAKIASILETLSSRLETFMDDKDE